MAAASSPDEPQLKSYHDIIQTSATGSIVSIVVESFTQPHSWIVQFDNCGSTSFEMEFVQNWEGPPDKDDKGVGVRECELDIKYTSAIHLFKTTDPASLFCSNQMKTAMYFQSQMGMCSGTWSQPLIQLMQTVRDWGLDKITDENNIDFMVENVGQLVALAIAQT